MAPALLTGVFLGLLGLVTTAFLGLRGTDISRHISYGVFSTLVTLFAHSMMMFYLIGKGKAVKDAMAELLSWPMAAHKFRKTKKTRQDVAPPMTVRDLLAEVWQTAQSPSAASCWPRAIVAAE